MLNAHVNLKPVYRSYCMTHTLRTYIYMYNNKIYYVSINIMRSRQEAQLSDDEH